jgi:hypothetical protein
MIGSSADALRARWWSAVVAAIAVIAALVAASCAAPARLITLPTGAGSPAPDAAEALAAASVACRGVSTLTAEISVSGSVGGQRVPHARLLVGVARPASIRIEATVPLGGAAFIFTAKALPSGTIDGPPAFDSTLFLPRDGRVLEHGRPDAVLEAVAGIPLSPPELRAALTGCGVAPDAALARHQGEDWIVMPDEAGHVYLQREKGGGPWRIVAATPVEAASRGWRAEYHDFHNGLPATIRLAADDRSRFDVTLSLSQVDVNTTIDDSAFTIDVPASTTPITLDELKQGELKQGSEPR